MINIRVAVRIRPFSKREILENDEIVVQKEGKSVLVTNPKIFEKQEGKTKKRTNKFVVDFCYDSKDPQTSNQEAVYNEIGSEVLDSLLGGYNSCVLAYGHSASGKTYTMMGTLEDPGLIPRLCQGLFDKKDEKTKCQFHVTVSFFEIYNEKVRDLLVFDDDRSEHNLSNFSLRVREHPKLGPYVQNLSQHGVTCKSEVLELLKIGNKRRSTATTENNTYSSRSHSVFTLIFKENDKKFEIEKCSKVHLVDLAGSERASKVQNKTRLKEGANINKSLVALGNVISSLAENYKIGENSKDYSILKSWQPFVPYRESILTWLLKDTLGGNSKTIMIATVSPASSCLNETINTLRYAKRTRRIMNQPVVNEDPKTKIIRELRKEISKLKSLLSVML
ncbi:unc-104, putative [Pediculus humanus corporis]|uniref:Kinesin-like protein n=1 Tax=Pediculus humanus subsp. corporis TaxID=121224 RepID=E0VV76_PEDHC|nr:unc-104, putative [Pediculus humanus corporis]EEB17282.1 unc-104, putative [Pediculus humanus corporis]